MLRSSNSEVKFDLYVDIHSAIDIVTEAAIQSSLRFMLQAHYTNQRAYSTQ